MPKCGKGYSHGEVNSLVESVGFFLPILGEEWSCICNNHNNKYPKQERTPQGLKAKLESIYRLKVPTGATECPSYVQQAKDIYEETKKMELSDGEGEEFLARTKYRYEGN